MAISLAASAYLVFNGYYNRAVANSVRQVSIPAVPALASIQQERRLSVIYLTQPERDLRGLLDQRERTEQRLTKLRTAADSALTRAPESIISRWATLTGYLNRLPTIRSTVDSRSGSPREVTAFYDELLAAATDLFDTQARVVPDVTASQGGLTATDMFRVSEAMSRAGSIIDVALGQSNLSQPDYLKFVELVGAYRSMLATIDPHLQPGARERYRALAASELWQQLGRTEQAVTLAGPWRGEAPGSVSITRAEWEALTLAVSTSLTDLTVTQADEVSAEALRTGNRQLTIASVASVIALLMVLAAVAWAVRQSQILIDRSLSVRLDQMARDASEVVGARLPVIMSRLGRGERLDLRAEMPAQHYGNDEIGQVGRVIQQALQIAVRAAADQAKLRKGAQVMLRGVARRPQLPLQAALMVVTDMQRQVDDAEMLAQLFDVHHKLAQTRRFLENLLILSGGQVGRKFRAAVPVRSVIKAAQSESRDYERVAVRNVPDVALAPQAVTDVLHLLAELIDNALQFSPPGAEVTVTCNIVEKGVAVEVEDRGMGMEPEELAQRNTLLATAPTPDLTALQDGSTIGLFVVAELARREGVQVTLRSSAYGGTLAIVLLPKTVIAADAEHDGGGGRHAELVGAAVGAEIHDPRYPPEPPASTVKAHSAVVPARPIRGHRTYDPLDGMPADPSVGGSSAEIPQQGSPSDDYPSDPDDSAGERPVLPKRTPQAHLVSGLRTDGGSAVEDGREPIDQAAAVESSLVRFARFRNNLRAGTSALDAPDSSPDRGNA